MRVSSALEIPELSAAPATPAAGLERVYAKAGGLFYKTSTGAEVGPLGAGGGGTASIVAQVLGTGAIISVTTTPTAVSGLSYTATTTGTYLVNVQMDAIWATNDGGIVGEVYLDGATIATNRTQAFWFGAVNGGRATVGSTQTIAMNAGQVLTYRVSKSGTGTSQVVATSTGFTVVLPGSGASVSSGTGVTIATPTTTYTAVNNQVVLANGTFAVTLPTATSGAQVSVKNTGTGIITVTRGGSSLIDGATTFALSNQYASLTVVSDGTNWFVV